MIKRKKRQGLTVRVEYEPNRLSRDCLQQAYQIFSPITTIRLTTNHSIDEAELDNEADADTLRPSGRPQ